jgi:hypothetical protein
MTRLEPYVWLGMYQPMEAIRCHPARQPQTGRAFLLQEVDILRRLSSLVRHSAVAQANLFLYTSAICYPL